MEGFQWSFFIPKTAGYQNIPQVFKVFKQGKSFGFGSFENCPALIGAGKVSPRTAALKDVFSATAFSSRRLVNVAVFMLKHQHIELQC